MTRKTFIPRTVASLSIAALFALPYTVAQSQNDGTQAEKKLPSVEVISTTPLPGFDRPKEEIPSNVQTANEKDIRESQALNLGDFINSNLGSVHVNDVQGNPFQMDVNYRGFTASPLLGTPQGLSVYVDGVRINQPFGDIVQWDLIPKGAIQDLTLMPGSNPLFGLNTLGGALSVRTKDGLSTPGSSVEVNAGSYGRRSLEFQTGGSNEKGLNWYVLANTFHEDGWRTASPSDVTQLFSKWGWKNRTTDLKLTIARVDSALQGNGFQQENLLKNDYSSVFTQPDITNNGSTFLNLQGKHSLNEQVSLSGNIYYRKTRTTTFNADLNEDSLGATVFENNGSGAFGHAANRVDAQAQNPAFKFPTGVRCSTNTEPNEKCNALLNRTNTVQSNYGFSGQANWLTKTSLGENDLIVGTGFDKSKTHFTQSSEFAYLLSDRTAVGINQFANGLQASENAYDQRVDLNSGSHTWSIFTADTLTIKEIWHLTTAARYNNTRIDNLDNLDYTASNNNISTRAAAAGVDPNLRTSLTGSHSYHRINPAIGIAYTPSNAFNPYASYSEANRAPTSIELGCADPAFGCRLPNSMAGDPHLNQVISRTIETGARGRLNDGLNWNATIFRTENSDDIMFVANSNATGYFKNFGKTRRQGIELGASKAYTRWAYSANYTYLEATYQTDEEFGGGYNSSADSNGIIQVKKDDKIPLIPNHMLKFRVEYRPTETIRSGLTLIGVGESFVRGNENNQHQAGITTIRTGLLPLTTTGNGIVPAYAVINWNGTYQASDNITVFGSIANIFDRKYYTAGALGPTAFTANGGYANGMCPTSNDGACSGSTMYSPGAPRSFWIGMRYVFDKPKKAD